MDSKLYAKHNFGNWYYSISKINALPLKFVIETPQFILTSTAIELKQEKIESSIFEIPKEAIIAPSPVYVKTVKNGFLNGTSTTLVLKLS